MENLKRYGPCLNKNGFATLQRLDNGGWVKFSDIKELLQTPHNSQSDAITLLSLASQLIELYAPNHALIERIESYLDSVA